MDLSSPATAVTAAAATTAAPELLPAAGPASACRHLPGTRFVSAASALRMPPSPPAAVMAEEEEPRRTEKRAGAGGDVAASSSSAAAAETEVVELEDRMDLLWEDFNEELAQAQRRARGGSWRERGGGGGLLQLEVDGPWSSSGSLPSDAESEPAVRGCGPVLRPSARAAGGARHCRRRAGSWVLLMRIFRRLFVVEKARTISAAAVARQRSTTRAR